MPPDLTPNIEEYFEEDSNEDCLERKTFITSEVHLKSTTLKKPPGYELRKEERRKKQNEQPMFLFNINDPIWKPIGLFGDNLEEDWPDSHLM